MIVASVSVPTDVFETVFDVPGSVYVNLIFCCPVTNPPDVVPFCVKFVEFTLAVVSLTVTPLSVKFNVSIAPLFLVAFSFKGEKFIVSP